MKRSWEGALVCAGSVIGAGFVSGREIVSFFTRYGTHSRWLIALAAAVMGALCALCMQCCRREGVNGWESLSCFQKPGIGLLPSLCETFLLLTASGGMVSASGHMLSLLCPFRGAYFLGTAGSLFLAWRLSFGNMRVLSLLGGALTAFFLGAILIFYFAAPALPRPARILPQRDDLLGAAIRAAAYGSMNIAVALGVVCRRASGDRRRNRRQAALTGLLLGAALLLANELFLRYPGLTEENFPVVRLAQSFGRAGYTVCVWLMELAIFTTLAATLLGFRGKTEQWSASPAWRAVWTLGLPLAVSLVGFDEIVDGLYAPAGLCCLATVFLPMLFSRRA